MALLGNYLTIRLQQHSSGVATKVVAETTSVDAQFTAEALESTEQADALVSRFEPGKTTINVSGDYLLASDGEQFDLLFAHANSGDKIEVDIYRSSTLVISTEGVFTSLTEAGPNSDALVTGAYSMELDVVAMEVEYGAELHTLSNAAADPNGTEANATTGFTQVGLDAGANEFVSQGAVKSTGSYAIKADCNDTPTASARFYTDLSGAPFNLVNGNEVRISFNARHTGTGLTWNVRTSDSSGLNTNVVNVVVIAGADVTFAETIHDFTYSANTRYFGAIEGSGANTGGVYFDNLSVKILI